MKFVKSFNEWDKVSENLKYHIENDIELNETIFRIGSEAYYNLFEEVKQYWDKGNIILKGPSAWMAKNLEVGKKAVYNDRSSGETIDVVLDSPKREGNKKFRVYRNTGRKDKKGNVIARKLEWGDPKLKIKNDDPGRAANFWARHKCDSMEKMNPDKAGFWACYAPTLFGKQLGLSSDNPW